MATINAVNMNTAASGLVWTANGVGTPATFQAAPSGKLVLISSQTASSSATIDFTALTTYSTIFVTFSQAQPVTNTQQLELLVTQDNSTWITTGYSCAVTYNVYNSTTRTNFSSTAYAPLTNTMPNTGIASGQFYCANMNTGAFFTITGKVAYNDSTAATTVFGDLGGQGTTGIIGIRFKYASGNIFSGTFTVYGLATS